MPVNNFEYWKQEHNRLHTRIDGDLKALDRIYKQKLKDVNGLLKDFYEKYAEENEITLAEAKQTLSKKEFREFNKKVREWIKSGKYGDDSAFMASLNRLKGASKVDRLQRLKTELTANISELKERSKKIIEDSLTATYSETEKATAKALNQEFKQTSEGKIRAVINSEFQGRRFSSRVWSHRSHLSKRLNKALADNFAEGKNFNDLRVELKRSFGTSDGEARRLLVTETARINSVAKQDSFRSAGFERYQYVSVLDDRTSPQCVAHDDKVYKIEELTVGVNAPPLHVYCRSTIVPYEGEPPVEQVTPPTKKEVKQISETAKKLDQLRKQQSDEVAAFHKGFSTAPDYIVNQLHAYDDRFKGLLGLSRQGAYYNRFGSINMGKLKPTDPNGARTWRHEYGHFLDHQLGEDGHGGEMVSYLSNYFSGRRVFTEAMKKDQSALSKLSGLGRASKAQKAVKDSIEKRHALIESLTKADDYKALEEIENSAYKKLGFSKYDFEEWFTMNVGGKEPFSKDYERRVHLLEAIATGDSMHFFKYIMYYDYDYFDRDKYRRFINSEKAHGAARALSDIVGCATNNKIAGHSSLYASYGHSTSYLKHAGKRQTECFANITDLLGRGTAVDRAILKAFTPNMLKTYEEGLKNANN